MTATVPAHDQVRMRPTKEGKMSRARRPTVAIRETAAERAFRQLVLGENSGKVPVEFPDLPLYVPLPTAPGDVVAVIVPRRRKRR